MKKRKPITNNASIFVLIVIVMYSSRNSSSRPFYSVVNSVVHPIIHCAACMKLVGLFCTVYKGLFERVDNLQSKYKSRARSRQLSTKIQINNLAFISVDLKRRFYEKCGKNTSRFWLLNGWPLGNCKK